jgi:hypothetical protein
MHQYDRDGQKHRWRTVRQRLVMWGVCSLLVMTMGVTIWEIAL